MTRTTDDIIIIGAGIAGLAAGCYAQMNGYQAVIDPALYKAFKPHLV